MPIYFMSITLYWWVWLIFAVVFFIAEISTVNLVSIWFVVGSIFAMVLSLFQVGPLWQIISFILTSVVSILIFYRFRTKLKITTKTIEKTNADRLIGMTGIVTERIDEIQGVGQVKVANQIWSASDVNKKIIKQDQLVKVIEIRGVRLIVEAMDTDDDAIQNN